MYSIFKCICFIVVFNFITCERTQSSSKVLKEKDKSSLVFVFDTTGSMYNDLEQLKEGAELILRTALEESNIIDNFVFVPYHDPAVGPPTITNNISVFKSALNIVRVYGGGDCPEKALTGIKMALNVSRSKSYIYVLTDATANDYRLVEDVLDLVQKKQSQVVFVLTGHCNDLNRPSYLVYQQIAAASSGQVFNLDKNNVHKVLDYVRSSIKARTVNLGSVVNPAGYNYTQEIPVDNTLGEVTVSVSGFKPQIKVFTPTGEQLTGPPKLVTTLDLAEIMVVKVLQPEPGNWSITVGSTAGHSVKVVGLSNLTFTHGFSVQRPSDVTGLSYRPLQGAYNYLMLSLTKTDIPVEVAYAEILNLDGKTLFEIPLTTMDAKKKIYMADAFLPPDELFYIAINGRDENNQELRRVGSTAIQAKQAEAPYLTAPEKVSAHSLETITLTCGVESLVPVNSMWTKDGVRLQQISSLQSTSVQYVINSMNEGDVGTYTCVGRNAAGVSQVATEVELLMEPPIVTVSASNSTLFSGETLTISCSVYTEGALTKHLLLFEGGNRKNATPIYVGPNVDGIIVYNETRQVTPRDSGTYTCVAAHMGGATSKSLNITVLDLPSAQIMGPHSLTRELHSSTQLMCLVENAREVRWLFNGKVKSGYGVNGSHNAMLDVSAEEGVWTCVALNGIYKANDTVEINTVMKPEVSIEGSKNITVRNGTVHRLICIVKAKPTPRIIWHRETDRFLDNTVTVNSRDVYKSVLTLDSKKERVNGTYFCFGENSEGIHQDSVTVRVRKEITLVQGFTDQSVHLYSKVTLRCVVNSYPIAEIRWRHNNTELIHKPYIIISEDNTEIVIEKVDFEDLGDYVCEAKNEYEKFELKGTLSVVGLELPVISKDLKTKVTNKGTPTILSCSVIKGNPKPKIEWEFKSPAEDQFSFIATDITMSEDRLQLNIPDPSIDHGGVYRCIAENVLGRDYYDVSLVVQYPPELTDKHDEEFHNKPLQVGAGQKVTFSCQASGNPKPIVVWTKDNHPVPYSKNVYLIDDSELVIEKASQFDSGLFSCNASSPLGSAQKNYTLVVYVPVEIAPPGIEPNLEILEGQLVELPCSAHGVPKPAVKWLQNGYEIAESRKYIDEFGLRFIANLTDFGEYTCIVKNVYGKTNFTFMVYIWVPPYIEPPLEVALDATQGSNVTLTCDAVGFPVPAIYWYSGQNILKENTTDLSFNEFGNLYVNNASNKHEGTYACSAVNRVGSARKEFIFSVNEPPTIIQDNYTGPYIATDKDTLLMISCKAAGKPKPYVLWSKDGKYLDKDSRYDISLDGTLTINRPSQDLSGSYVCTARNTVGHADKTVSVEIYSIPSQLQAEQSDSAITLVEGSNVTVDCPLKTSPGDTVTWYKDATLISNSTLYFPKVSRDNGTTFACVARNTAGAAHSYVRILVEWPPKIEGVGQMQTKIKSKERNSRLLKDMEKIVEMDKGDDDRKSLSNGKMEDTTDEATTVVKGQDVRLRCGVDAKPEAEIKWLQNSKLLLGEYGDTLKIIDAQMHHAGIYKCIASNKHGTMFRQFTLDVLVPPFISEFDLLDVQLKKGFNATLECNAKGFPEPEIKWTYNNTNWVLINSTLVSVDTSESSEGTFRCVASNPAGAARLAYRVRVAAPAAVRGITLFYGGHGSDVGSKVEVALGSNVRISCQAAGRPIPRTQWFKNGDNISENIKDIYYADLVLKNVKINDAGEYICIASNEGGFDHRTIKVDVLEPPKIFQTLFQNEKSTNNTTELEILTDQPFYLHCHPYGNPMPEIYWFKDGVPLRLFDDSMVSTEFGEVLQTAKASLVHSGNYTCVARSRAGYSSITYLVDVLVPPPTPKEVSKSIKSKVGTPLVLNCPVEGSPVPNVMWIKHPYTELSDSLPKILLSEDNVTLTITTSEVSDSGGYSCVMTNKVGATEFIFNVTVEQPPTIAGNAGTHNIENQVVAMRRSIVLKCEVDGHPPPKISWLKDTQQLSSSASNIHRVLGNSLLAIWSVSGKDAGQYICVAENDAGTAHRRFNVIVKVPGKWSEWSGWSYCNATCGLGLQARARTCQYIDDHLTVDDKSISDKIILDKSACRGANNEKRKCHMPPCEEESISRWSAWSAWSLCSARCGAGTQARGRRCRGARCRGDNVQIRKCPDLPLCNVSHVSSENEVSFSEEHSENNPYEPEATFEFHPEMVDPEDFYMKSGLEESSLFDVEVTQNLDGSELGLCAPGFRHNATTQNCDDIDECEFISNHCHSTQVCVNTAGAYRCGCAPGFMALGAGQRCLDINECSQEIHGCQYACVNVAGGYVCACPRNLRLHTDKHHCVPGSEYNKPYQENADVEYLSASLELPAKYKNTRN